MTDWLIKTQYDASEARWLALARLIVRKWGRRHSEGNGFDPDKYKDMIQMEQLLHIMFKIDMEAYGELGYSLTGVAWKAGNDDFPDCPVPKDLDHYMEVLGDEGWFEDD